MKTFGKIFLIVLMVELASCTGRNLKIQSGDLIIEINNHMETRVNSEQCMAKPLSKDFMVSEFLAAKNFTADKYILKHNSSSQLNDLHGKGTSTELAGLFQRDGYRIEKHLSITVYDSFPGMAFYKVTYINSGSRNIQVTKWVNNNYSIQSNGDKPDFWSFQGQSTRKRADWILPVDSAFSLRNFMGMNNTDYGGGIPVTDIWRRDAGIAVGHVEQVPKLVSLPVNKDEYSDIATIGVEYVFEGSKSFQPGDTIQTCETFVSVHTGDCFATLNSYSEYLQSGGIRFVPEEPEAFEPVWCAWGYWQKFTITEIERTLPKVKELGIKWVDIDDGYQITEGDWNISPGRFPEGVDAMRNLVKKIHAMGLKAKIWWAPLAVDPGAELLRNNPDIIIRDKDGAPQYITGWECYYLAPTYYKTIDHTKSLLKMYLEEWNFDGLKMDGMHINCVLPDFNESHDLEYPEESNEQLPMYFRAIYDISRSYKPNVVIQNCPCGDCISYFNLPYMNQAVASDPWTSWQTRLKGKVYKALRPGIAYYGDHIELSDGGLDFASQVGVGAVPGTKFTWPEGDFKLTPGKEQIMKKWIALYNKEMISKGKYLGTLYDIGYDKPEAHTIQKGDTMYYAFYNKNWDNELELKGLNTGKYKIIDYENDKDLGLIDSSNPKLKVSFMNHLLIKVYPSDKK
jgi:alpha-galactosidase